MTVFFATDLHGRPDGYRALVDRVVADAPDVVLLGGDLLPSVGMEPGRDATSQSEFVTTVLAFEVVRARAELGDRAPRFLLIPGNDDARDVLPAIADGEQQGLWENVDGRRVDLGGGVDLYGYGYVPPTPSLLKDGEKYDLSRFVDSGCISPEAGRRTVPVDTQALRWTSIATDLEVLAKGRDVSRSIFLFHAPPYRTALDRAALDGRTHEGVPLDVHVGSVAIRKFIEDRQPLATLHGHVHESVRLTGVWHDRIGATHCLGGAHDGREVAVVVFDPQDLDGARRERLEP